MNGSQMWRLLSLLSLLSLCWTGIDDSATVSLQETSHRVVYDIAWSPDGGKIAVGYGSEPCVAPEIQIQDANTQTVLHTLPDGSCISLALDWSPDSTKIVVNSGLHIWDVAAEQIENTIEPIVLGYVDVKWNPDGRIIAFTDIGGGVYLADTGTGKTTPLVLSGSALDWSPDGTKLLTGSGSQYENKVSVYDVAQNQSLFASEGGRNSVDWSPDGAKIVSSSLDDTVRIWDATSGAALLTLFGHTDFVTHVTWSPDSQHIASASNDGTVRIWDVETGEALAVIQVGSRVFAVAWSPDNSQLAYGGLDGSLNIVSAADFISPTHTPPGG